MGMTIDKAIKQLETYTIPCGKYKEAYDLAVDTMRKYQKIEQIYSDYMKYMNPDNLIDRLCEVVDDGNDD